MYVCGHSTFIAPEQVRESNRSIFFSPVNFTAVMYDQLSFIQEISIKNLSKISFDILCDFSIADENSRSQNHHSNYYTSLYISYCNLSVLLQTAVFQKYLTMWNFYFFWEITMSFISTSTMTASLSVMSGYLSWSLFAWQMCLKLFSCCFAYLSWGSDNDEMFYLCSVDWEKLGKQSFSVNSSNQISISCLGLSKLVSTH